MTTFFFKKIYKNIYIYSIYLCYILYALSFFNLYTGAIDYFHSIRAYLTIYISLFLIIRFNPFVKAKFTDFDRRVVFTAGTFLFTTTALSEIALSILQQTTQRYH